MGSDNNNRPNPNSNSSKQQGQGGFVTIAGLTPDKKSLPYSVSTEQVCKFITQKLNALQFKIDPDNDNIGVQLWTIEAGRDFLPFVVVLTTNAAEEQTNKKRNTKTDSFFTAEDRGQGKTAVLKDYVYKLFSNYMYDSNDYKAFFSEDWRRSRGVSRENASTLKSLAKPKFVNPNKNSGAPGICFIIDPIRVLHDMLRIQDDNRNFMVNIESWNKQENGIYTYKITRDINGNKHNKNNKNRRIVDQINYNMRGNGNQRRN